MRIIEAIKRVRRNRAVCSVMGHKYRQNTESLWPKRKCARCGKKQRMTIPLYGDEKWVDEG